MFLGVDAILQMWVTSSYIQIWRWPGLITDSHRFGQSLSHAPEVVRIERIELPCKDFEHFPRPSVEKLMLKTVLRTIVIIVTIITIVVFVVIVDDDTYY